MLRFQNKISFLEVFHNKMSQLTCVLRNIKKDLTEALPSIEISSSDKIIIGRSVETKIDNPNVSRNQLMLKVNFEEKYVLVKFIGKSPSALNGFILKPDQIYEAKSGDIIEVLYNTIFYEVLFQSDVCKKRKSEDPEEMEKQEKKPKIPDDSSPQPAASSSWEVFDAGNLYVYTSAGVKASSKIAGYDLDNTLIRTVSGNVFPKNIDDWQINLSGISKKLETLHNDGFKIVIFTNQAGIGMGKTKIEDFKKKIQTIVSRLNVPIQAFIAPNRGKYRKPMIGSWETLCDHKNEGIPIDIDASFFVGDAAGRGENKIIRRKKDHSIADRLFALNVGLDFYTPEEYFHKESKSKWIQPDFDPKKLDPNMSLLEPETAKLKSDSIEVIMLIGYPGSGKSFFAQEYLKKNGYEIISRDQLKNWQKCVSQMESCIKSKSCVIDNTNPDSGSRKRFIDVAKKLNVPIRAFLMNTSYKHAKHNNAFRELTDPNHEKISDMVFNIYKSKFEEPSKKEGFSEIVRVNLIPKFRDSNHKKIYNMFLLEK